jgi:hypothetical protein
MIKKLFNQFAATTDGDQSIRYTEKVMATDHLFTYSAYRKTAEFCAAELRRQGVEQVEIIELESTGKWGLGGWILPRAWDCENASLSVISPVSYQVTSYKAEPISLVQHSAPTPPEGIEAELVMYDPKRAQRGQLAGKVIFTHLSVTAIQEEAAQAGALGMVTDFIDEFPDVRTRRSMPEAHRWVNDAFKPANEAGLFAFSLNHFQGQRLEELLNQHTEVRVHVNIYSCIYDSSIGVVTGLIPGQTEEEVLVLGHLYEVGALDNGSGTGLILELARNLAELKRFNQITFPLKRGIRFLHTFEMYGTFGFFEKWGPERTQRIVVGLNLDALGGRQEHCGCPVTYQRTPHSLPSYANTLIRRILQQLATLPDARAIREASFYETIGGDNHCADPLIGIQCASLWMHPSRLWHTSADTLDTLDPRQLQQMGQIALTYLIFTANADAEEVAWLAGEIEQDGFELLSQCQNVTEWEHHRRVTLGALDSLAVLGSHGAEAVAQSKQKVKQWQPPTDLAGPSLPDEQVALLEPYTPRRTMIGATSCLRIFELLPSEERIAVKPLLARVTDNYLASMLHWCDGKRSLAEVYRLAELEIKEVEAVWSGNASDMMTHELAVRAGKQVAPADALAVFEILANLNLVVFQR